MPPETVTTYLADYRPPHYRIHHSALTLRLDAQETRVTAVHSVTRINPDASVLELDHAAITLAAVQIDDEQLDPALCQQPSGLTVPADRDAFTLTIECTLNPAANTALSGLYQSRDMLCTQCEAQGFRRIMPGLDRPDNLATYRVRLIADRATYPVLLCNGNLVESGVDGDDHYAVWDDPFPKPTYLFAIVAGRLECLEDTFTTMDNREITLRFYARGQDITQCAHAMASLKHAMRWDEQVYGRVYDLDLYNVVAVDDFNMGAMENKSLNVFNTQYVLADVSTATDHDFQGVEAVIGHEYFHNWSGNRVTCRDWFQLSLKEGFTVFREQQFCADMNSPGVQRIDDANQLRTCQFPEDASAMAHPVRPESYQEINNFYTATVYEKGAEVIRMLHTLLGAACFRRGTDLYFDRYDGMAVTTDDFVQVMAEVSGRDLSQFNNWYCQAGTPRLKVTRQHDPATDTLTLIFEQSCRPTPRQETKSPFLIPVRVAIFSPAGAKLVVAEGQTEAVIEVTQPRQTATFSPIPARSVPSILRQFSAPVALETDLQDAELGLLLRHDDDPFNRWESAQRLYMKELLRATASAAGGDTPEFSDAIADLFGKILSETDGDRAIQAKLLVLPNTRYIGEQLDTIDPIAVHRARHAMKQHLTTRNREQLQAVYATCQAANTGRVEAGEMAHRDLRDTCLDYLCVSDDAETHKRVENLLQHSRCMTDADCALTQLTRLSHPAKAELLDQFYQKWQDQPLVVNKWLRAQATVPHADTVHRVTELTGHAAFDRTNPNRVYSLIMGFTHGNAVGFHQPDGSGYAFLQQWVRLLDPLNPQVCARLVSALNNWQKYIPPRRRQMQQILETIADTPNLSADVREIVGKNLEAARAPRAVQGL